MDQMELFAREEAVIQAAEEELARSWPDQQAREAFASLLREYAKLLKVTRRLMRLSDRNERELNAKHKQLETLSTKLAKYLSPQVYDSIFTGRQEVQLASQRKKLTIFFSDLAGFTETVDKMESEDLTQLLNHYLTEMSRVALEHGATIDKYIGDAIMMFFGDPETRGVKEDALACVKMAIAMQRRMTELRTLWRDAGIETPPMCRMGIHTGYCTVGNFGSNDRMDYTIIGSAVNLASRLERDAPSGGILISFETWAQVKDEVECEEMGRVQLRGMAYPVATYRVLDLYVNRASDDQMVRASLPHLKLELDPRRMAPDERDHAATLLRDALKRLAGPGQGPRKPRRARAGKPAPADA